MLTMHLTNIVPSAACSIALCVYSESSPEIFIGGIIAAVNATGPVRVGTLTGAASSGAERRVGAGGGGGTSTTVATAAFGCSKVGTGLAKATLISGSGFLGSGTATVIAGFSIAASLGSKAAGAGRPGIRN